MTLPRPTIDRPPSRHDNPFATCWTRPGALPYLPMSGLSVDRLLEGWERTGRQGQIVGPHGVGKSTLLLAAGDLLAERGESVRRIVFRADEPTGAATVSPARLAAAGASVLLVDGLEQLSWWEPRRLLRRCYTGPLGVLATTHHPAPQLPVLAEVAPSLPVVLRLHGVLTSERPSPTTPEMVAKVFAEVGGDIRELWFRLYDLHEALTGRVPSVGPVV